MSEAAWQKGFELEWLKQFALLFKTRHKALVFGAFGLTKERDVADYLSKKQAIWTGSPTKACLLFTVPKVPSEQTDFAQRTFVIEPGSISVKAFAAYKVEDGEKIVRVLGARAGGRRLWVEIFEEDEVAREVVKRCGLFYCTTKISAGSEIKGIYSSHATPLAPLPREELATLEVLAPGFLSAKELAAIRAELQGSDDFFAQHYSSYNKRKSWTSFALRGYQNDPTFIIKPSDMSKAWKENNKELLQEKPRWTTIAEKFPATIAAAERLGVPLDRVRFMRLRSKDGELSRHSDIVDREAGVQDGHVARFHIPIFTSDAVTFQGWGARGERIDMKMPEGALCYLDQRKPHAAKNTDPSRDRTHLVIDAFADSAVRRLIAGGSSPRAREVARKPEPFRDGKGKRRNGAASIHAVRA